jgi:hypothetical protein
MPPFASFNSAATPAAPSPILASNPDDLERRAKLVRYAENPAPRSGALSRSTPLPAADATEKLHAYSDAYPFKVSIHVNRIDAAVN